VVTPYESAKVDAEIRYVNNTWQNMYQQYSNDGTAASPNENTTIHEKMPVRE